LRRSPAPAAREERVESREENKRNACDADDIDVVHQARNGGRAALEKLIRRHKAWIDNIAIRIVSKRHDAEGVTEEVLVKVISSRLTGNFPGGPVNLRIFFGLEGDKIASLEIIP
jgi:hypothetical protein